MARVDYTALSIDASQIKNVEVRDNAKAFMATEHGIETSALVDGEHIGYEAPRGVGFPTDFEDYTPIHRVDSPADSWNDGTGYVVYFEKEVDGAKQFWKATDADPSTLAQLTSGDEFDLASSHELRASTA
ncbi:hypothetical protein N9N08_00175 [bacterium]|jgi:hypothetical protein|nr:hypothetical protein [bacterium]